MEKEPDKWLENQREELDDDVYEALKAYREASPYGDRTIYDNLSRMKRILDKGYAPDGFDITDPSLEDISAIVTNLDDSDENPGTRFSYKKALKAFYRDYRRDDTTPGQQVASVQKNGLPNNFARAMAAENHGPYYPLVMWFSTTKNGDGSKKVQPWMILSPDEAWDIISCFDHVQEKAFNSIQYSCAATSGEVLQAFVHDVDLKDESIYVRGNKQHESKRMELLNQTLEYLRNYLKWHPAVDDPYDTENVRTEDGEPVPLWVKKRATNCQNCDKPKTYHSDNEKDTCSNYEQKVWAEITGRSFFTAWRNAVEKSDVTRLEQTDDGETITEDDLKMKHLRKSMLTRFAAEIDRGVKEVQLRKFARWKPGEGSPQHYIELADEVTRDHFKQTFKGVSADEDVDEIVCHNCNTRNDPGRNECIKCHRPLDPVSSAKLDRHRELADKLASIDPETLERAVQHADLHENPKQMQDRITELEQKLQQIEEDTR